MAKTAAKRKPVLLQMEPELYNHIMKSKSTKMKTEHRHTLSMNAYMNEELSKHFLGKCKDKK